MVEDTVIAMTILATYTVHIETASEPSAGIDVGLDTEAHVLRVLVGPRIMACLPAAIRASQGAFRVPICPVFFTQGIDINQSSESRICVKDVRLYICTLQSFCSCSRAWCTWLTFVPFACMICRNFCRCTVSNQTASKTKGSFQADINASSFKRLNAYCTCYFGAAAATAGQSNHVSALLTTYLQSALYDNDQDLCN